MSHWKLKTLRRLNFALRAVACVAALLIAGCDRTGQTEGEASRNETAQNHPHKPPKLSLHRPKTCEEAVLRMRELVGGIAADGPLPQPLKYKIREVIHGTGASAHSHFYRIDEDEAHDAHSEDDDHGHEHMESSEKQYEAEVEPYTELTDIARWLPRIAADADTDEKTWNEVKATSQDIVDALRSCERASPEAEKRAAFRSNRDRFDGWMKQLEISLGIDSRNPESGKDE